MIRKTDDPTIKEKIAFIDENSHVLVNIMDQKLTDNTSVLEYITEIIMTTGKKLNDFEKISELEYIINETKEYFSPLKRKKSDSISVIFCVADYINVFVAGNEELNKKAKDRLRIYSSSFKNSGKFSKDNRKFVNFGDFSKKEMVKR